MAFINLILAIVIACILSLTNPYAITGSQGGVNQYTGERPFRQEFSSFKTSGPAFDLYILSLQLFQQHNQSILLSYFQVAGNYNSLVRSNLGS